MIITLTTDIGWEYAAEMKGKILSINPEAKIIDISHEIAPQNIRQGASTIFSSSSGLHVVIITQYIL